MTAHHETPANNHPTAAETESAMTAHEPGTPGARRRKISSTELALDLRTWIAAMFATFGSMLTVYGAFFATADDIAKGAGINLNLWTGVGMIAVALLFALWLAMRPSGVADSAGEPGSR